MDEGVLDDMADLVLRHLGSIFEEGVLPECIQFVARRIFTWPDGRSRVWIIVIWPN